jgi:hypothetical protein
MAKKIILDMSSPLYFTYPIEVNNALPFFFTSFRGDGSGTGTSTLDKHADQNRA